MRFQLWHLPVRLATGAFILNSGLNKLLADDPETYKRIHSAASTAYPQLESFEPELFTKALGGAETVLGSALLVPLVSPGLAGAALTAFSGSLVGLYLRTPGAREPGSLRPSRNGTLLAKDVWMLGIGLALLVDSLTTRARRLLPGSGRSGRRHWKSKTLASSQ